MTKPSVSVIVACLNSGKALVRTIESFIDQDYPAKELVIVDGGSTDTTRTILRKNTKHIGYSISEPDRGISDAFNKGVRAAKSDYIIFLGAGDYFYNSQSLSQVLLDVQPKRDLLVAGRVQRVSEDGQPLYEAGGSFRKWHLLYKMAIPHQGLLTHKNYFKKYGLFDLDCQFAMDYELLLRAYKQMPPVVVKNVIVACWKEGGVGTKKLPEVLAEYDRIRKRNKVAPVWVLNLINQAVKWRYGLAK